ncbi:PAS domain-containing SpoIIE family protein phosphatase/ATP-binding protein [Streptomyces sp. NBC_01571]|uniref:SpoIIE family protein phosphatase n=1 Tax=Streptomyces sp. NBC_01571 TaxID=2975883 RepID=UPI00224F2E2D|nr:SpoIIE family protein phosphatase [Streptomyces sp. NBC_01571]MCX4579949.1 PAS domain-containing SpoIIE family protein phosphatase/ATP-binding protein [Streptomyces sp. NBC_01571]
MTSTDVVTQGDRASAIERSDSAIAMLDDQGTVVGWTRAAERLVGYSAADVVGRSAAIVLPSAGTAPTVSAFVERCRAQNGWSGTTAVCHQDGRVLNVSLRISMLRGRHGAVRWLVSLTDIGKLSWGAMSESVRESLLARTPIGVVVRDPQLRCTWVDDTMEHHDGVPRERRLGRRFTEVLPGAKSEELEAMMRQVLKTGTTRVQEYRLGLPRAPHREHSFAVSIFCLQDADGRVLGVCVISIDVTESRRARERLTILSEASTRLGRSLDVMRTSQELAELAVPLLADYVAVDLEQSVPFGEGPPVHVGSTGERLVFRRAGLASIHQGVPESPWARGEPVLVRPASPFMDVLRTGRSHLEPFLGGAPGTWIDEDPARARKIHENGMHSLMVVPIRARRALLGVVVFIRTEDPGPFQEVDLLLAEELVSRAALSLDNARQYAREHTAALALQRTLLPHRLSGGTAVETASRYLPADMENGVGGDWFDVIPLSGARVALVVGDVVGHGINAAANMGRLRTAVHTLADMELPPGELLAHLDDTVQRLAEEDADSSDQPPAVVGATCLYAVYDPVTRRCAMAGAGHPPPVIIDPQGTVTFPDLPTGTPLGMGLGVPFESVELELPEGSLLALYTDGLVETRDQDIDVGMRRLGTALSQPGRSLEDLCARATETLPGEAPSDDVTLLLVRTRSLSPARVASWTLPSDQSSVRSARHLAARQLTAWGLERLEDPTKLIVSELVTNAVRHATGPVGLRLIQHQVLTCEVTDASVCSPRLLRAGSADESGRGLLLVAQLSRRWGSRSVAGGKVVWAEEDLASVASRTRVPGAPPETEDHPFPVPPTRASGTRVDRQE